MKKYFLNVAAMILVIIMAIPALADERGKALDRREAAQDEWQGDLREYHQSVKDLHRQVLQEKQKVLADKAALEAEKQQHMAAPPAPPAGEFIPSGPSAPVAIPVMVPYELRYYTYYDGYDWVCVRLRCHRSWRAPHRWRLVGPGDWHCYHRHAIGKVEGGRLFVRSEHRPVPRPRYIPGESRKNLRDRHVGRRMDHHRRY